VANEFPAAATADDGGAYRAGQQARYRGTDCKDNPYPAGTAKRRAWDEGWHWGQFCRASHRPSRDIWRLKPWTSFACPLYGSFQIA
jgi:hypothetical protein